MMLRLFRKEDPRRSSCTTGNIGNRTGQLSARYFLDRDSKYLLKLCQKQTYDCVGRHWDQIERCCEHIVNAFSVPLEESSSNIREQLLQTDGWGNTPLHLVCYQKPPSSVVGAILKAASCIPGIPGNPRMEPRTLVNDKGATPLLICCKVGACRNTIKLLLHGAAATMSDWDGATPFHALLHKYHILNRIPTMRSRWTDLNDVQKDQWDAIQDEENFSLSVWPQDIASATKDPIADGNSFSYAAPAAGLVFPLFLRIVKDLILSAWKTETPNLEYASDLHGAALIADAFPEEMIDAIIRVHTEDQPAHSLSHDGALSPLQLTLVRRISSDPTLRRQHAYFFRRLLEVNPPAEREIVPGTSRSLFCHAIATGHHWSLDNDGGIRIAEGPVQALFKYCPAEVRRQDQKTRLYPFMLAATNNPDDGMSDQVDTLQVDTIYNLLRSSPELVMRQH